MSLIKFLGVEALVNLKLGINLLVSIILAKFFVNQQKDQRTYSIFNEVLGILVSIRTPVDRDDIGKNMRVAAGIGPSQFILLNSKF